MWVQSSSCCFPRELVSFVCPRELVSFDPWHVTSSCPIGKRIWVGRYDNRLDKMQFFAFRMFSLSHMQLPLSSLSYFFAAVVDLLLLVMCDLLILLVAAGFAPWRVRPHIISTSNQMLKLVQFRIRHDRWIEALTTHLHRVSLNLK